MYRLPIALPVVFAMLVLAVPPARAATINVAANDSAALIAAINTANNEVSNPGADTIVLGGGTYSLAAINNYWYGPNALPAITSTIVIDGGGVGATIQRSGAANYRLFYISGGNVSVGPPGAGSLTLINVTIANGFARGGNGGNFSGGGGGLGAGGAIYNQGTLNMYRVTLSGNTARGGDGGSDDGLSNESAGGGGMGGAGASATSGAGGVFSRSGGGGGMGGNGGTLTGTSAGGSGGGGINPAGDAALNGGSPSSTATGGVGGGSGGAGGNGGLGGAPGGLGGGGGGNGSGSAVPGGPGGIGGGAGGGNSDSQGGFGGGGGNCAASSRGGFGGASGSGGANPTGDLGFGGGGGGAVASGSQPGGFGGGLSTSNSFSGGGGAGLGGAVFNDAGTVVAFNVTIFGNAAQGGNGGAAFSAGGAGGGAGFGGGIFNRSGNLTLTHVTVSGNAVTGGIGTVASVTTDNGAAGGGAVYHLGINLGTVSRTSTSASSTASLVLANSVLANSTGGSDLVAHNLTTNVGTATVSLTRSGANIVETSTTTGTVSASGPAIVTSDPQIGASLALNGAAAGSPRTLFATSSASPIINAGTNSLAVLPAFAVAAGVTLSDQRGAGFLRISGPGATPTVDLGATEVQAAPTISIGAPSLTGVCLASPSSVGYAVTINNAVSVGFVPTTNATGGASATVGVSGAGASSRTVTFSAMAVPVAGTLGFTIPAGAAFNGATAEDVAAGGGSSSAAVTSTTFNVGQTPTISPASLPNGTVGVAYNQNVSATPASTYTYSVSGGTLPTGLLLAPATGQISGNPTVANTFGFTIAAAHNTSSCSASQTYTVVVGTCPTVVTNGNDSGTGSLRQTLADACPGSTITFAPAVTTVTLTTAELSINKNLTIDGGASLVTITRSTAGGTPAFRIFRVQGGNVVNMNALRVSNGDHPVQAGGIQNDGTLTLTNMHITGNRSPQAGGIQNDAVLVLDNSSVTDNVAASFGGGLIAAGAGTTTLSNCTFSGNRGGSDTGAIGGGGTALSITSCTISGNTLVNSLGVGAGITLNGVPTTLRNSIVIGNTEGGGTERNIDGTLGVASAFNVLGAGPAGGLTNGANNNQVGVTLAVAGLGSLANHGGLTPTLPLLPGSVAINAGTGTSTPATDQRGIARPQQAAVDVGAFESRGFTLTVSGGTPQATQVNTAFASPLAATVSAIGTGEPVQGGRVTYTPPASGASAALATNPATINGAGVASIIATANATTGSYAVTANANGNNGAALSYSLQNNPDSTDLAITKTNGTSTSTPGTATTYTITASNAGPIAAPTATVTDTFPAALACNWTCVGAGGASCVASGSGNINASVNLPVGGSVTYTATCAINAGATGTLSNTATVSSPVTDSNPANNSATDSDTLNPQADVSITKTDGQASVNAGATTVYTIVASNTGPSNAPVATVADTFPAFCVSPTWTCAGAGGGSCTVSGSGNINQSVNLPAGGSVTYTANCPISAAATGTLSNTATITSGVTDPGPGNNTATDSSTIVAVPVLSIDSVGLTEGDSGTSNLQFTVTRSTTSTAFSVDYATASGSATAGSDYTTTTGTVNFTAGGAATQSVNVPIIGDNRVEATETFTLALSNPTGTAQIGANGTGTGTIADNDSATVQFNPTSVSQAEGTSPMVFTVTLTNPVQSGVTLTVNTSPGTATAADFTAITNGTVSFAPNSTTAQTVNVAINGDALDEDDETFSVALSNLVATGAVSLPAGTASATGTIVDDDALPVLGITSPSQPEGNSGSAPMNFVVTLAPASGRAVSFTRATADGSATAADNDYVALAAQAVTIPAGQTSVSIPVTINGDAVFEGNESFTLNLSGITNATPGSFAGTGTILDDDQQPTTTEITSDNPDPSDVTTPYTVVVTVRGATSSPTGTVTVDDGTGASCGPVALVAGTAPASTASCVITSTTDGAKTLTATYTPASTAFGASSDTEAHTVTPVAVLQLGLTASPNSVTAGGGVITYVATATNTGPSSAPALTITLPFPAELGVTGAVASAGGSCSGTSTVICSWPGATAPGESRTATIAAVVQVSASRTLSVTATANSGATVTAATATAGVNIAAPIPVDDPRALLALFAMLLLMGGAATRRVRAGTVR